MQEQIALSAFRKKQSTKYLETLVVVKTIMHAANLVAAAVTGGNAPQASDLQELLSALKGSLMPEYLEEQAKKAERVKEIMERESKIGSFKVQSMAYKKRNKKGLN